MRSSVPSKGSLDAHVAGEVFDLFQGGNTRAYVHVQ
jgi:hypothetical protein